MLLELYIEGFCFLVSPQKQITIHWSGLQTVPSNFGVSWLCLYSGGSHNNCLQPLNSGVIW